MEEEAAKGPCTLLRAQTLPGRAVSALRSLEHSAFDQKWMLLRTEASSPPTLRSEKLLELSVQLLDFLCLCSFFQGALGKLGCFPAARMT